jgi:hypothetical protein
MTAPGATRSGLVRFAAYTAVLYAGLVHNAFCVPEDMLSCRGEFRPGHQTADCSLVVNRLRHPDAGTWTPLGYWEWVERKWRWYPSQFGLTGVVLGAVARATGAGPEQVVGVANLAFGLATAAVLAAFFASVARRVGPLAGHVGVVLAACTPPLLHFAPSVYWALPLVLGPFVLAWLASPWTGRSTGRFALLLAGVGTLVCLKCLCGYEYATSVILAPVAALAYHRSAAGDGLRKCVLPAGAIVAVGLAGFAVAILLHAAQLTAVTGQNGFEVIRERAALRTNIPGDDEYAPPSYPIRCPELSFVPERARLPARCFVTYFYHPAVASPQTWGPVRFAVPLWAVAAAATVVLSGLWRVRRQAPAAAALVPAAAVGFAASVSWQVMAINHMYHHGHLNLIVFCVPFLPLAYAGFGAAAQLVAERWGRPRLAAAAVVLAAVAAVGVNAAVVHSREADREANRVRAEERVRAVLRGEEAAVALGNRGLPPTITGLPVDPPYLPHGSVFIPAYGPSWPAGRVPPFGAVGWVLFPQETSAVPPMAVVVVKGGEVVPSRAGYFRYTGFEPLLADQVAWGVYQVAIPAGVFVPGEHPRLFAVPTRPGEPVIELTCGR